MCIGKIKNKDHGDLEYNIKPHDIVDIRLKKKVIGDFKLEINFLASISKESTGCYAYLEDNDLKIVTTHFEPDYARKAFPCLDEPGFKSVFNLSIKVLKDWRVISNMPGSVKENINTNTHCFETSPSMSCYLLNWTICKHNTLETTLDSIKIYLNADSTEYSYDFLELAKQSLKYYTELFKIPYPLPKLDLISINSKIHLEMSIRAMENWGAITFIKSCLEKLPNDTFQVYFRNCRTLCHEVSHMWFGNLVTMSWWDDLWLNEGFARFMEFKCLDKIRPEFKVWIRFISDVLYQVLGVDYPVSKTHPIQIVDLDYNNISTYFDSIGYLKGASVLRMLQELIGENEFDRAIIEYLNKHMWKSVTSKDFFEVISQHTSLPIIKFMETWTKQPCFPLVIVSRIAENVFKIQQQCYDDNYDGLWIIPINFVTNTGENGFFLMQDFEQTINVQAKWIKVNHKATGYYRVLYSNYTDLYEDIKKLDIEDRYSVLNDHLSHYYKGLISFDQIIQLIKALIPEYDYSIILDIEKFLNKISKPRYNIDVVSLMHDLYKPIWYRYKLATSSPDLDFPSLKSTYINKLINLCKDQEVAQEILLEINNTGEYQELLYPCLIVLSDSKEALHACQTDLQFALDVLEKSDNVKLIRQGVRKYLIDLGFSQNAVLDIVSVLSYAPGPFHFNSVFKGFLLEFKESNNELYRLSLIRVLLSCLNSKGELDEETRIILTEIIEDLKIKHGINQEIKELEKLYTLFFIENASSSKIDGISQEFQNLDLN